MNFKEINNNESLTPESEINSEKEKIRNIAIELYQQKEYNEEYYAHGTNAKALQGMINSEYKVIPGEKMNIAFTGESYGKSNLNKKIVSVGKFNKVGLDSVKIYSKYASQSFALTTKNIEEKIEENKESLKFYEKIKYKENSYAEKYHQLKIEYTIFLEQIKNYFLNLPEEEKEKHDLLSEIPIIVCGKNNISEEKYIHSGIADEKGLPELSIQIIATTSEKLKIVKKIVDNPQIKIITIKELESVEKEFSQIKKEFIEKIKKIKELYDNKKIEEALFFFKKEFPNEELWNYDTKTGKKIESDQEKIKYFLCFNKYNRYSFEYI
jgi:DNA-binding transcriptional regulator/RsmH inhibitor MraZ